MSRKEKANRLATLYRERRNLFRQQLQFVESNADNSPEYQNGNYREIGKALDDIDRDIREILGAKYD